MEVDRDAAPVVAVERLEHDGVADPAGHPHGVIGPADDLRGGHRQAGGRQQPVRQFLVGGDVDGERGRQGRHGGPDPLLVDAIAELHQGTGIQSLPRDVAGDGLVQDGLGGGTEGRPLAGPQVVLVFGLEIELIVAEVVAGHQVIDQPDRQPAGQRPDGLVEVAENDVVDAALAGRAGLAAGDLVPSRPFEFQRDMFDDVPGPGALDQPLDETAVPAPRTLVIMQSGQQRDQ